LPPFEVDLYQQVPVQLEPPLMMAPPTLIIKEPSE